MNLTYKEVAADLGLRERTIKYHMGRILNILHVESKAQAFLMQEAKDFLALKNQQCVSQQQKKYSLIWLNGLY